jgi:hypothetical protein
MGTVRHANEISNGVVWCLSAKDVRIAQSARLRNPLAKRDYICVKVHDCRTKHLNTEELHLTV